MRHNLLIFVLFFLSSSLSIAQKVTLNFIHVKNFRLVTVNGKTTDTTYQEFTVDSEGFMQGAFSNYYKNSGKYISKGAYKNNMLVDSCFWYDKEGRLFAKGNFIYKDDYRRTIGLSLYSPEKNYHAYLNDTLLVYNHSRFPITSILIFKDNLKHGVFYILSKDRFVNIFTYRQDTLHGYFRKTSLSQKKIFLETGNFWNGDNSYDGWYHKYLLDYKDTVLIEKTLYNKNFKQLSSTYYVSGKPECNYYYSTPGVLDSVRCIYEEGSAKSFVQYDHNGEGVRFSYSDSGQIIEKSSCKGGRIDGYSYEYSGLNTVQVKKLYRNDTIITKEQITNNVVWQRVFYKDGEVEKVDWFDNKGNYKNTTCCENIGTRNAYWGPDGTPPEGFTPSVKQTKHVEYRPEKNADLVLFKYFPEDDLYSNHHSDAFVISRLENKADRNPGYYKYVLNPIKDSLMAYAKTKDGACLSKLKAPLNITVSLCLLESDIKNGSTVVSLKQINSSSTKKIKKALDNFFKNRTIQYSFPYFPDCFFECSYTLTPQ